MRLWVLILFFITACVSRSIWLERFQASQTLSLPPIDTHIVDPENFSFAFVGDLHVGGTDTTRFRSILEKAKSSGDEFIVLLGDLTDKGEATSYEAIHQALQDYGWEQRVVPLLGNHDIFTEGWENYQKVFGAAHYSVDIGNSRFIAIDSADGIIGKEQFDWLRQKLEEPQLTHTFLLSHYMPVVPGQQTYLKLSNFFEAQSLMQLSSEKNVTAMLGGHYHSFCRGKIAGVEYVVAGGGGGRRMEPVKDYFYVQALVDGQNVDYRFHRVD